MNPESLAPIFLDNKPVVLKDPKPLVSAVLTAGGQQGVTQVRWLQAQTGSQGTLLRADHTLDRTSEPTKPIYLTSLKAPAGTATVPWGGTTPPALAGAAAIVDEEISIRPFSGSRPKPMGKRESFDEAPAAGKKGVAPAADNEVDFVETTSDDDASDDEADNDADDDEVAGKSGE